MWTDWLTCSACSRARSPLYCSPPRSACSHHSPSLLCSLAPPPLCCTRFAASSPPPFALCPEKKMLPSSSLLRSSPHPLFPCSVPFIGDHLIDTAACVMASKPSLLSLLLCDFCKRFFVLWSVEGKKKADFQAVFLRKSTRKQLRILKSTQVVWFSNKMCTWFKWFI